MGFVVIQKEDLAAVKIKNYLVAVKANLSGGLTKIVVKIIIFIINAIEIAEELIVFIGYKVSKLKVFGVAITITKRVRKGIKIIRQ